MKHFRYILLPLFILLLSGCFYSKPVPLAEVSSAAIDRELSGGGSRVAYFEGADAGLEKLYNLFYSSYVDEAASPAEDLSFIVTLSHRWGAQKARVVFDLGEDRAYVSRDGHWYRLPEGTVADWLGSYPQRDLLTLSQPALPAFSLDGAAFEPAAEVHWDETVHPGVAYASSYTRSELPRLEAGSFDAALSMDLSSLEEDAKTTVRIYEEDGTLVLESAASADGHLPLPGSNGTFRYTVETVRDSGTIKSSAACSFLLAMSAPPSYRLSQDRLAAGSTLAVQILQPANETVYTVWDSASDRQVPLFPYGDSLIGILALDSRTPAGTYELAVRESGSSRTVHAFTYAVEPLDSPRQNLVFDNSTGAYISQANYDYDNAKRAEAYASTSPEPLWEGAFLQPVQGRITTAYATRRYYNDSTVENARHNALDIAAPTGTPVAAANTGVVVLAEELKVAGGAILIDHGMGIFTAYYHLSSIDVSKGDRVEKGEPIGKVGSTGFSTGAHLHWSIYKDGVYINPWPLIEKDPLGGIRRTR